MKFLLNLQKSYFFQTPGYGASRICDGLLNEIPNCMI